MSTTAIVARLLLGLVFALSSASKLRDLPGFASGVERFGVLPRCLARPAAAGITLGEAAVSVALLSGVGARIGILVAVGFLVLFLTVMAQNARRNEPLPCFCFGTDSADVRPHRALVRLMLLLAVAIVVVFDWVLGGSTNLTSRPTIEALLLASAALMLGTWAFQFSELSEWRRIPVPPPTNTETRVACGAAQREEALG